MSEDRVALVTGGGRGIGAATCLALARRGLSLAINYRSDRAAAEAVAEQVRALGQRAETFAADIADEDEVATLTQQVLAAFGRVDILVNNAGFGTLAVGRTRVTETTAEAVDRLMGVHVRGPLALCRALVPRMRGRGGGHVIMVSSVSAERRDPGSLAYAMAKAAMETLGGVLAREEREHNIRVNVVAPGLTDTDMGAETMRAFAGVEDMRTLDGAMPFGFVCQPEDIANAIAFLVSDDARYITAQRLTVDGGGF